MGLLEFNKLGPFIIVFLQTLQLVASYNSTIGDGQCIWYDMCDPNPEKPQYKLNCRYSGLAKELPKAGLLSFKRTCPELAQEIADEDQFGDGKIHTCCSVDQIIFTEIQITAMNTLLQNCPACQSNLRMNFCYFACHPRHSAFLTPTRFWPEDTKDSQTTNSTATDSDVSILTVTQYQTEAYINVSYESCKNVYFAPLNGPAMDVLCGPWGSAYCTPQRLFDYFGNNYLAPFNITYVYTENITEIPNPPDLDPDVNQTMTPFDVKTFPCNTSDPDMNCRCEDCEASCPPIPDLPPPPEPSMVGEVRVYVFIIILIFCAYVIGLTVCCCVGHGLPGEAPDEDKLCTCNQKLSAKVEESLEAAFKRFSEVITYHPLIVLGIGCVVVIVLSCGITKLKLTTNPVDLWAAPTSRAKQDKDRYDNYFGPFYRTNQIIITSNGIEAFNATVNLQGGDAVAQMNVSFGPVFNDTFMEEVMALQQHILQLEAEYEGEKITFGDVCIKPMAPNFEDCLVQSPLNYWQDDPSELHKMTVDADGNPSTKYLDHLVTCLNNPSYVDSSENCMGSYGGPVFPYVALGGYLGENESLAENPNYEISTAIIITLLVQNYVDPSKLGPAIAWEGVYLDFIKNYTNEKMNIAFYAERSLEDEIKRESKGDISTVLISYFVMFAYVAITLGSFSNQCNRICIETKITLGFSSVILVFLSVAASIGICSYIGIEGTLFVIEVIPFLVLAVGVDNIFLLVQTWQRIPRREGESIETHVARCVGKVAPSMLLATSSEAICFFLGALSDMPAVHAFSFFAGFALTIDFLLQITCLVALIVLDAKREEANRCDVFCCIQGSEAKSKERSEVCLSFFENVYAPFLLSNPVRYIVLVVFAAGFCVSCALAPNANVGLEQDIGMPDDSYVLDYFDGLAKYLSVGSPVYFVMEGGYDFANISEQNLVCQSRGCRGDSILARIFVASSMPKESCIGTAANSWLDGYLSWITDMPQNDSIACCRLDAENNFINSSESVAPQTDHTCLSRRDLEDNRPKPDLFMEYLPDFLIDNPHDINCPQAGHPTYATAVNISTNKIVSTVGPTNFMAYHTILKVSKEFTDGVDKAYQLAENMKEFLANHSGNPVDVFPYSVFYVYYEQYLTMWSVVAASLGISFAALFLVMIVLTGFDIRTTIINMIIIIMITIDILGTMVTWDIQLNAISLVNLVMAAGISVEFCSHISHAFAMTTKGTKVERATKALAYTGSSVLSGITLTKFGGIIVLAFSNSKVFTIFYFRMYLLIVLYGAAHGLVLLPVLLSIFGPPANPYVQGGLVTGEPISLTYINNGFT